MIDALLFNDYYALSSLIAILIGALTLLLVESFWPESAKKSASWIALGTLFISGVLAFNAPASESALLTPWLAFDPLGRFFTLLFILIGAASILLGKAFFKRFQATEGEYYFLLLSALFGLILIGQSADFLTLFLGIETLSLSLYILTGYMKKWTFSHESAMKYFLMGSLAAALLLYGIALLYGAMGNTSFSSLLPVFKSLTTTTEIALFLAGIGFVTLGLSFEAALFPFHTWAPDVYDAAPTPVTAFMAVGTKVGAFAAFARVFLVALPDFNIYWSEIIALLAYPTLIYANFVALQQTHLRRFFAYSGIANAGFLLLPLAAGGPGALSALLFYLVVYALSTLGCFAALAYLDEGEEGVKISDLKGLFKRAPFAAALLSLSLLTLAGLPPTAGFFAKFYLFKVALSAGYTGLVVVALLVTILSIYYYLRLIVSMGEESTAKPVPLKGVYSAALLGAVISLLIFALSVYPGQLMGFSP